MENSQTHIYKVNNSTVELIFGDILNSQADVLVISGSIGLPMIGGLPGVVLSRAGATVLADAQKHGDTKLGDVVVTSAGTLPYKYLFQAVTVTKHAEVVAHLSDEENSQVHDYIIGQAISKSLRLMSAMDLNSIAFPCLGLGVANMGLNGVAKITAKTICEFLYRTNKAISVKIYILDTNNVYNRANYLPFFEWMAAYSHEYRRKLEMEAEAEPFNISIATAQEISSEIEKIEENPHKVFISYSSKDIEKATAIGSILDSMGVRYWMDRKSIYSGSNYKELIVKAIKTTEIVLFLSSENSNRSRNVAKEISIADENKKVIIPLRLDNYPMHERIAYDLSSIDSLDLFSMDGKSVEKLKQAIRGQLRRQTAKQ